MVIPDLDKEMRVEVDVSDVGGRDGIVEEPSVHIYYAYLKPTWGYGFNSLVVLCAG